MSKRIECFAHIPYIRLPKDKNEYLFNSSYLTRLDFTDWQALSKAGGFHRDDYNKTDPVFFKISYEEDELEDPDELFKNLWPEFHNEAYYVYFFILLTTGLRLPEPELSVGYYHDYKENKTAPIIGSYYYEAVAYTQPEHTYEVDDTIIQNTEMLLGNYPLDLANHPLRIPELENAKEILMQLSRPDFSIHQDFVYCVAAMEAILVPEYIENLSEVFSTRGASLFSKGHQDIFNSNYLCFKAIYDLRSRIVHSENYQRQLTELSKLMNNQYPLTIARRVLCTLVKVIMNLHLESSFDKNFTISEIIENVEQSTLS